MVPPSGYLVPTKVSATLVVKEQPLAVPSARAVRVVASVLREPLADVRVAITAGHALMATDGQVSDPVQATAFPLPVAATVPEPSGQTLVMVAVFPDESTTSWPVEEEDGKPGTEMRVFPFQVPLKAGFRSADGSGPAPPPLPPQPARAMAAATISGVVFMDPPRMA
jgi:hypothetical protein